MVTRNFLLLSDRFHHQTADVWSGGCFARQGDMVTSGRCLRCLFAVVVVVYCLINYAVAFLMGELVSVVHSSLMIASYCCAVRACVNFTFNITFLCCDHFRCHRTKPLLVIFARFG